MRASKSGKQMRVGGYAARYGVTTTIGPNNEGFKERIAKRAFDGILSKNPDCVCLFNHDANLILGRTSSGTLRLRGDDTGLAFDCDLPNTTAGRDAYESVTRGDIKECSFAFMLDDSDQQWGAEEDDGPARNGRNAKSVKGRIAVRTITNFKALHDVSLCTSPAYSGTSVSARNTASAEVRSYIAREIERVIAPKVWIPRPNDICFEDRIVIRDRRRRLNEFLEDL